MHFLISEIEFDVRDGKKTQNLGLEVCKDVHSS